MEAKSKRCCFVVKVDVVCCGVVCVLVRRGVVMFRF